MPERLLDPIFLLDTHERFWPLAAESVEEVPARIVLPPLRPGGEERDGGEVRLGELPPAGRMNFPETAEEQEERLRPKHGNVGYRRLIEDGGLTWAQYWLWYLYNPKTYGKVVGLRVGRHEGDWEFVQVGYRGEEPVCMAVSQHHSGGRRVWTEVELRDERPVVYVARDSHANFFKPVDQDEQTIGDDADGGGDVLDAIEWREFGPWATWNGRWGNSLGDGKSPESPGRQRERWYLPRSYYERAEAQ